MRNEGLVRLVEFINCSYPHVDSIGGGLGWVREITKRQGNAFFNIDYLPPDIKCLGACFPEDGLNVRIQLENVAASSPICYRLLIRRSWSLLASQ